jgi:hypothetical protein
MRAFTAISAAGVAITLATDVMSPPEVARAGDSVSLPGHPSRRSPGSAARRLEEALLVAAEGPGPKISSWKTRILLCPWRIVGFT